MESRRDTSWSFGLMVPKLSAAGILTVTLVSLAGLFLAFTSSTTASEQTSVRFSRLEPQVVASDKLSTTVFTSLQRQGLQLESFAYVGNDGRDSFWMGSTRDGMICLVGRHVDVFADWVVGAGCLPLELTDEIAIPLTVATVNSGTRAVLLPDGFVSAVSGIPGLSEVKLLGENIIVLGDFRWGEEIQTTVGGAGKTITIRVPAAEDVDASE